MNISARTVWLVAAKELRESLRDRRTLFVALLLPVLLYPLMMLAVAPLVNMQKQKLKDEAQPIAVTGEGADALNRLVLDARKDDGTTAGLLPVRTDTPLTDLHEGLIALWVEADAHFAEDFASGRSAKVTVHKDSSDDKSLAAAKKFDDAMRPVYEREVKQRLEQRGMSLEFLQPIKATMKEEAPPERRAAYLFGKLLAFILVILTLSSSFYPAVDAVAGEKERGTMETLLVAPCGRAELVLGKFVAVLVVTLVAATLNLGSMALTLGPLGGVIAPDLGAGLRITPTVILGVLALLVPLSALFSAVSLALSTLARSVKEGQHYLTPLFLVVMPLAMVVVLPNVPLTTALAPVPVTNAVLFFRDLLLGKTDPAITAIVMLSTFAYAGLALWACVSLFLREETLFRGPEGSTAFFPRPAPRERPGGGAALFLFTGCMALVWYGQSWFPQAVVRNVIATQFLLILAPCLLLTLWLRARPWTTFQLGMPRPPETLLAAAVIGIGAPVVNMALLQWFSAGEPSEPMRRIGEEMGAFVTKSPLLAALVFGVLPAVCEEIFFRGFVLSGMRGAFRGRGATAMAVVASSACFALFHIFPEKWAPTFLMGVLLAVLAVRTGSIWPGMIAHALNNATAVLSDWKPVTDLTSVIPAGWGLPVALFFVAAGLAGVVVSTRRRDIRQT